MFDETLEVLTAEAVVDASATAAEAEAVADAAPRVTVIYNC